MSEEFWVVEFEHDPSEGKCWAVKGFIMGDDVDLYDLDPEDAAKLANAAWFDTEVEAKAIMDEMIQDLKKINRNNSKFRIRKIRIHGL